MNLQQLMQWYDFTGKTAVITGGTGVLGGEIACALVGCGANVAVLDRNPNLPDVLKTPLDAGPGKYMVAYADVLSRDVLSEAAQAILQAYGRIDILINAAGGNHPQATTRPDNAFFDLPKEALDFVFDLNIMGTILPSQVFGRLMADQGDGVILNVSSMNAFTPLTRIAAYSAAKGRRQQLHPMAGGPHGAGIFAAHPRQRHRPRLLPHQPEPLPAHRRTNRRSDAARPGHHQPYAHGPLRQPGRFTRRSLWLLSPAAAFVTGTIVPIDGGFHAFSGV
jgi:NAD(P)-dependent dehydrogenase (short-subunit alcohol dehydrogenase family)